MILKKLARFFSSVSLDSSGFSSKIIWIAYSGGIDSAVLLHAAKQALSNTNKLNNLNLKAIHINHQMMPEANSWEAHCKAQCEKLSIICDTEKAEIKASDIKQFGLEAAARKARYSLFKKYIKSGDYLLMAHHLDDQAETLLLQLCRGAGVKGLSGMPALKAFGDGFLARPFLTISREEITAYAKQHHLLWIKDASNQDNKFARNYLRNKILPLLDNQWQNINKILSRTAANLAEAEILLAELAEQDLLVLEKLEKAVGTEQKDSICASEAFHQRDLCVLPPEVETGLKQVSTKSLPVTGIEPCSVPVILRLNKLREFSEIRQKNILRHWLAKLGYEMPSAAVLSEILKLISAKSDRSPLVQWGNIKIRRYRDNLYAFKASEAADEERSGIFFEQAQDLCVRAAFMPLEVETQGVLSDKFIHWTGQSPLILPRNLGVLNLTPIPTQALSLTIKFRSFSNYKNANKYKNASDSKHASEKIKLKNRPTKSLKKFFQELAVPTWERKVTPLIFLGNKLIAVGNYATAEGFEYQILWDK